MKKYILIGISLISIAGAIWINQAYTLSRFDLSPDSKNFLIYSIDPSEYYLTLTDRDGFKIMSSTKRAQESDIVTLPLYKFDDLTLDLLFEGWGKIPSRVEGVYDLVTPMNCKFLNIFIHYYPELKVENVSDYLQNTREKYIFNRFECSEVI